MDHVSMAAVLRAVKRVLPEQRWRTTQGKVDIRSVCEALEASFKGDGAVSPSEAASKLEIVFSMNPPLREKAALLAAHLQEEMHREHAARVKTRLLVIPAPPTLKKGIAASPASEASLPRASTCAKKVSPTTHSPPVPARRGVALEGKVVDRAARLGSLITSSDELYAKVRSPPRHPTTVILTPQGSHGVTTVSPRRAPR